MSGHHPYHTTRSHWSSGKMRPSVPHSSSRLGRVETSATIALRSSKISSALLLVQSPPMPDV